MNSDEQAVVAKAIDRLREGAEAADGLNRLNLFMIAADLQALLERKRPDGRDELRRKQ